MPRRHIGNDLDIGASWRSDGPTAESQTQLASASEFGIKQKGHPTSRSTVAKLLRKLDYSPKVNARRVEAPSATPAQRNKQFEHIGEQREEFAATDDPIISVDTQKKN